MYFRVAIDFAGGRLQNFCLHTLGQAEHIDCTMNAGFGGLHRIVLVVDWRSRARQIVDFVHFNVERKGDVMANQFEMRIAEQMTNIVFTAGKEVIYAQYVVIAFQQFLAKVRTEKSRPAGDEYAFGLKSGHYDFSRECLIFNDIVTLACTCANNNKATRTGDAIMRSRTLCNGPSPLARGR